MDKVTTKKVEDIMDHPEMWSEFSKIWREATKGMTKKERRDFAKWHDEIVKEDRQ